ncbi:MAG: tetratricopeptide repeat protein [Candidatus Latescibacteria bacterium]|nr:tetratricopeptide repeat protein [Candidatus Latescibacterota bacterium]
MADTDILTDRLENLLEEDNFQKACDLVRKWEGGEWNTSEKMSGRLLLLISKTYYFNKMYGKAKEYLSRYELNHPALCQEVEYICQKDKLLILEQKADRAVKLIENALDKPHSEEDKYFLTLYLGKAHFWNGNYLAANRYLQKCCRYYLENRNQHMLGLTVYMMGYIALQRRFFEEAEKYFNEALECFGDADKSKQIGNCYNILGILKYRTGRYEEAKKNIDLAEKNYSFASSKNNILNCRIARACIAIFEGEYDFSEEILKATFRESRQVNFKRAQALSAEFLGEISYRRGNYRESEAWLEKALELAKESAPRGDVAVEVYRRLGDVKAALGELDEAEEMLSEAMKLCEHLGDKYELGSVYRAMGVVSVMRDDIDLARSFFNESITTHKMIGERFELASTCMLAARHYLRWSMRNEVKSVIREKLISDAHKLAVEAMHLYSSIKLDERADQCRKFVEEIKEQRGGDKDSIKTEELIFKPEWLCGDLLVAGSEDMKNVIDEIEQFAETDIPIFIRGETGTGKEVIARLIHEMSGRDDAPLVAVNCASIPDTVFESELFGHCRGAFTGADRNKPGLIEKADGGTLFLDEVCSMPVRHQAKMLRVLEERKLRRVGETRGRDVDIRVLSASNGNIDRMIENDRLRKDFYYRLAAKQINLSPLRDRKKDIEPLLAYYMCKSGKQFRFEEGAVSALCRYSWPGNVRELVNLARVLTSVREKEGIIYLRDLPTYIRDCTLDQACADSSLSSEVELFHSKMRSSSISADERKRIDSLITALLEKHSGNKTAAARDLGVSRKTLYRYIRKLDISPPA